MDIATLAQHVLNGLMLGIIYAMVAAGFSLFFGVLDVVQFSHGDVVTTGGFAGLGTSLLVMTVFGASPWLAFSFALIGAIAVGSVTGAMIGRFVTLPMRAAPSVNILLSTLMTGTALRELIRLGLPNGGNPKPFPPLLPTSQINLGTLSVGIDSVIILVSGLFLIICLYLVITRTQLGLAIRAVAQDADVARLSGINFQKTVVITFVLGSGLAAVAGLMIGIYYREIAFNTGVLLGIIGFTAAVVGGLGNILGAIVGGFLFAAIQTIAATALPFSGAYKDVVAFGAMVILMGLFPKGLLTERESERV